ncbi:hypothetical protein HK100_003566 [Physocladia obscura]|uniref:Heterokaryon incompatibility domain-containing protein n=1 Tax=Physocladia obscura TaxID=109957 RepID=A0AAD5SVI0_9FUNG|nr:hypothetical protein HK100_003566 [Physocladia obscura]
MYDVFSDASSVLIILKEQDMKLFNSVVDLAITACTVSTDRERFAILYVELMNKMNSMLYWTRLWTLQECYTANRLLVWISEAVSVDVVTLMASMEAMAHNCRARSIGSVIRAENDVKAKWLLSKYSDEESSDYEDTNDSWWHILDSVRDRKCSDKDDWVYSVYRMLGLNFAYGASIDDICLAMARLTVEGGAVIGKNSNGSNGTCWYPFSYVNGEVDYSQCRQGKASSSIIETNMSGLVLEDWSDHTPVVHFEGKKNNMEVFKWYVFMTIERSDLQRQCSDEESAAMEIAEAIAAGERISELEEVAGRW